MPQSISVIVPLYNGGEPWKCCLDALLGSAYPSFELIVVDDGSTDGSREYAQERDVPVIQTPARRSGPALARNLGAARAQGDILFFVDADVVVNRDTLALVSTLLEDSRFSAVFGSYDDSPGETAFLSQYRNLLHHYIHQTSLPEATTFWAGCGAIRRQVFQCVGGFSPAYTRPSIEDIELGYRLTRMGYRIRLARELQVKHLKRWTFRSILQTDIRDRAIPWAELLTRDRQLPRDLNLKLSHRVSAVLCWLLLLTIPAALWMPVFALLSLALAVALVLLNRDLYGFFLRRRGLQFLTGGIALHWLYYLYSIAAYLLVVTRALPAYWLRAHRG